MSSLYQDSAEITTPNGNSIIWRYMELDKFLHLITQNKLHFSRLSKMTDKYEGTLPESNLNENLKQRFQAKGEVGIQELVKEQKIFEEFRDRTYINCWTIDKDESYALWKIYLKGSSCGVAIRTTIGKLKKSLEDFNDNPHYYIGKVEYSNFIKTENPSSLLLTITKRVYYEYEKEVRVFFQVNGGAFENNPILKEFNGWDIDIDTKILIDEIYISPFAGSWFRKSFESVITKIEPSWKNKIKASKIRDR